MPFLAQVISKAGAFVRRLWSTNADERPAHRSSGHTPRIGEEQASNNVMVSSNPFHTHHSPLYAVPTADSSIDGGAPCNTSSSSKTLRVPLQDDGLSVLSAEKPLPPLPEASAPPPDARPLSYFENAHSFKIEHQTIHHVQPSTPKTLFECEVSGSLTFHFLTASNQISTHTSLMAPPTTPMSVATLPSATLQPDSPFRRRSWVGWDTVIWIRSRRA